MVKKPLLTVYLDEDDLDVNKRVLALVEQLRAISKLPHHEVYVRYLRHRYAGLTPILYGVDGSRIRGLQGIEGYIAEQLAAH